jgi:protein TonB
VGEVKLRRTSGSALLDETAQATIRTWTFVPARRGPRLVESWVEIPVKFSLTAR